MKKLSAVYTFVFEGNDIETKRVQKLKAGDPLLMKRIADGEDTFEICLCHADGKEIDLLSYKESVGIAPYMDANLASASAFAESVEIKPGKTRAKDVTVLKVRAEYEYDETALSVCGGDVAAFVCGEDIVLSLAAETVTKGDSDIIINRPYLNLYTAELPLADSAKSVLPDGCDKGKDYVFSARVLFDETFSKCRISAKITDAVGKEEFETELSDNEKQSLLTFVNHFRIFEGEQGIDCEIEQE